MARTFGNARQAIAALDSGVVLADRSHWGRIRVGGEDRLAFLHNQSTNDFKGVAAGEGRDTVGGRMGEHHGWRCAHDREGMAWCRSMGGRVRGTARGGA